MGTEHSYQRFSGPQSVAWVGMLLALLLSVSSSAQGPEESPEETPSEASASSDVDGEASDGGEGEEGNEPSLALAKGLEETKNQLLKEKDVGAIAIQISGLMSQQTPENDGLIRTLLDPVTPTPVVIGMLTAFEVGKAERFFSDVSRLYELDTRVNVRNKIAVAVTSFPSTRSCEVLCAIAADLNLQPAARRGAVSLLEGMAVPDKASVTSLMVLLEGRESLFTNSPNLVARALQRITRQKFGNDVEAWLNWWAGVKGLSDLDFASLIVHSMESSLEQARDREFESWKDFTDHLRGRKEEVDRFFSRLLAGIQQTENPEIRRRAARLLYEEPRVQSFVKIADNARVLIASLKNAESVVVLDLCKALGSIGAAGEDVPADLKSELEKTAGELARRFQNESEHKIRQTLVLALGALKERSVTATVLSSLASEADPELRAQMVLALGEIGDPQAVSPLGEVLNDLSGYTESTGADTTQHVRQNAAIALGSLGDLAARQALQRALEADPQLVVRYRAVEALAFLGESYPDSANTIALAVKTGLTDAEKEVRKRSANVLLQLGSSVVVDDLVLCLGDPEPEVRLACVQALKVVATDVAKREKVLPALIARIDDTEDSVSREAVRTVATLLSGDIDAVLAQIERLREAGKKVAATELSATFVRLQEGSGAVDGVKFTRVRFHLLDLLSRSDDPKELQQALTVCSELQALPSSEQSGTYRRFEARIYTNLRQPKRALEILSGYAKDADGRLSVPAAERWEIEHETNRANFLDGFSTDRILKGLYEVMGRANPANGVYPPTREEQRARGVALHGEIEKAIQDRLAVLSVAAFEVNQDLPKLGDEVLAVSSLATETLLTMLGSTTGEEKIRRASFACLKVLLNADDTFPASYDPGSPAEARLASIREIRVWMNSRKNN